MGKTFESCVRSNYEPVFLTGLDVRKLSEAELYDLRRKIPEAGAVVIRNQTLTVQEQLEFTARLGDVVLLPPGFQVGNHWPDWPSVTRISNVKPDGTLIRNHKGAEYWHQDLDFLISPKNFAFSALYCETVAEQGGATGFADARTGYNEVMQNESLRKRMKGKRVAVSVRKIPDFSDATEEEMLSYPDAEHGIEHLHTETGRKSIYMGCTSSPVVGMEEKAAKQLLDDILDVVVQPQNVYIHAWRQGDLVLWDNTSVMHRGMGGYGNQRRVLFRTQAIARLL